MFKITKKINGIKISIEPKKEFVRNIFLFAIFEEFEHYFYKFRYDEYCWGRHLENKLLGLVCFIIFSVLILILSIIVYARLSMNEPHNGCVFVLLLLLCFFIMLDRFSFHVLAESHKDLFISIKIYIEVHSSEILQKEHYDFLSKYFILDFESATINDGVEALDILSSGKDFIENAKNLFIEDIKESIKQKLDSSNISYNVKNLIANKISQCNNSIMLHKISDEVEKLCSNLEACKNIKLQELEKILDFGENDE